MGTHLPACCGTTYRPGPCLMGSGKKKGGRGAASLMARISFGLITYIHTPNTQRRI